MKLFRLSGWQERLTSYLTAKLNAPFDWAYFDCGRFTGDALFEITGYDLAQTFRDRYHSEAEVQQLVAQEGGFLTLLDREFTKVGFTPVNWKQAHRGDPCYFLGQGSVVGGVLGVCTGTQALVLTKESGLQPLPMSQAHAVWSIPYA